MTTSTHTLSVLVEDKPGVLARVASLFSRRGYNIQSLAVGATEHKDLSRMTIVVDVEESPLEQITKHLNRLIDVVKVLELTEAPHIERELALVKVAGTGEKRVEALRLADIFRAKVVDTTLESFIFEITGAPEKIDAFADLMRPLGLSEMARTGVAALARGI